MHRFEQFVLKTFLGLKLQTFRIHMSSCTSFIVSICYLYFRHGSFQPAVVLQLYIANQLTDSLLLCTRSSVPYVDSKPLAQFCICLKSCLLPLCMRNVAAGIVVISLAVYYIYFCLFFVCFLTACFWRNKDA